MINILVNQIKKRRSFLSLAVVGVFCALSFASCDDMLAESPKTIAAELFYNTPEEVESAVNAIYVPLRSSRAEQVAILDAHTDWGYGRGSRAQYNDFAGLNAANSNAAASRWNAFYQAIRNANLVIANAPNGTSLSEAQVAGFVAEAKFLRALSYFDLVRNWGGVPLRREEDMTEISLRRSSVDEVYALILSDLHEAEAHLPTDPKHLGRPTTLAAKTMLADVYLTLGRFEEARDKAWEVIQANKFSLIPISSKEDIQWNIFGPELTTTPEEVFYFKFARELNQGNYLLWILNHPNTGFYNYGGAYAHYSDAKNPFYVSWEDGDYRKELWDMIDFGLGATTLVSGKYIDPAAVSNNGSGNDTPVYRFAEVLLIYAEAAARVAGGPTEAAMECLNQVRRRAYGHHPANPSSADFKIEDYDAESFIDLVLRERAYEFQFEGKRWYDLKRTGTAAEVILETKGLIIAEAHYLWPIPTEELNINKALDPAVDQNPGY